MDQIPKIGKKYKHYSGCIYTVVDIVRGNQVRLIKDSTSDIYDIGLDMWNCPITTDNNLLIQRFTKYAGKAEEHGKRKRKGL